MNTIEFRITPPKRGSKSIEVKVEALIDGHNHGDYPVAITDLIFGGAVERSNFNLYSCTCGNAGCAGFHDHIQHRRIDGNVQWDIPDTKLQSLLGCDRLTFDTGHFDSALSYLRSTLEKYESQGLYAPFMVDDEHFGSENSNKRVFKISGLQQTLSAFYQGQTDMENLRDEIDQQFPGNIRFSWELPDEGDERHYTMRHVDAAAILLRLGQSLSADDSPMAAELPKATQVIASLTSTGNLATAEQDFKPLRRFLDWDYMDSPNTHLFYRDEKGVFVRHP